ncbi:MAG: KpsF/GutQ family sugar-phosphate isomerase [Sphingobium sp.]|nr:KpsF/GutQ family sugar-phosphate isomerase [Sphingobium sp.]
MMPATVPAASDWALDVLRAEAEAILASVSAPPAALGDAINRIADARSPVVCCGVGKSGLIATKVAATMASLGIPAFSLAAGDAAHGDLGMVTPGSVVLLFSNSGTTSEILRILPGLRAFNCHIIGLVGRAGSPLATASDTLILLPITREADHIGMAPTASTTLQMAMGDALAVAASRQKGFTREDFLRRHPAGLLGLHAQPVTAIMRTGGMLPTVLPHMALAETVTAISSGRMGATCVVDWEGKLLGLIVDGDIRRVIQARGDLYSVTASAVMRSNPIVISGDATVGDALDLMRGRSPGLLVLPVTDDAGHLLGMVHSVDLVQS